MSEEDDIDELRERVEELHHKASAAHQFANNALSQLGDAQETIDEQQDTIDRLEHRVGELEALLDTSDEDYTNLTKGERVARVRKHLIDRGNAAPNGKAAIDYNDVRWSVFSGEISQGHAYDLMDLATDSDGFSMDTSVRPKQLRVDTAAVKQDGGSSRVNNSVEEEAD